MVVLIASMFIAPVFCKAQNEKYVINKFLTKLPSIKPKQTGKIQKLQMKAIYVNMDKNGNLTGKIKVTGDYTSGLEGGNSQWNNVSIFYSKGDSTKFDEGKKLDYMEGFKYKPSSEMMKESSFSGFPKNIENIYARNLIWDMMAIEDFAWNYTDSLHLNQTFILSKAGYNFEMAGIGDYSSGRKAPSSIGGIPECL